MRGRRDKIGILEDLVRACMRGKGITRLMMTTNLNYRGAREHVQQAMTAGLVKRLDSDPPRYVVTSKGREFLDIMENIRSLLSGEHSQVSRINIHVDRKRTPLAYSSIAHRPVIGINGRRSKVTLYACILASCIKPKLVTRISNRCFINRAVGKRLVRELVEKGLLTEEATGYDSRMGRAFTITELGILYLEYYMKLSEMLKDQAKRIS